MSPSRKPGESAPKVEVDPAYKEALRLAEKSGAVSKMVTQDIVTARDILIKSADDLELFKRDTDAYMTTVAGYGDPKGQRAGLLESKTASMDEAGARLEGLVYLSSRFQHEKDAGIIAEDITAKIAELERSTAEMEPESAAMPTVKMELKQYRNAQMALAEVIKKIKSH